MPTLKLGPGGSSVIRMTGCLLTLGLFSINSATSGAETFVVPTDTSWRAIGPVGSQEFQNITTVGLAWEGVNVGWNNSLAFDDSDSAGWGDAIFNGHSNIPNGIWPSGDSFTGPTPAYFRKKITINGPPTLGSVDFIVDDDVQIYVNGDLVFNDTNGLANLENGINFTSSLTQGVNLIALKVHDQQGTEGFGGTFQISFVPEPSALGLAAFGFLAFAAWGWRRQKA
jgi:hypothetical protein